MESEFPNVTIDTAGDALPADRTPAPQIDPAEELRQKRALAAHCVRRFKQWLQRGRGLTFSYAMPDDVGAAMIRKYETPLNNRNYEIAYADGSLTISAIKP